MTNKRSLSEEPRSYHHGDLRKALLEAAVQLIEARGLDAVSVREVAKMTGVSPGAPFRHFATRTALLTAVAEEAIDRLTGEINLSLQAAADENPLLQFRAIGVGFLRWVFANPTHFQVISTRAVINFEGSTLRQRNDVIRTKMTVLMQQAAAAGLLRTGDVGRHQIAARALVYGLGRMYIDGQFPSWELNEREALGESIVILDQFISSIRA
ncbi:TetR/AcrR family transcriptional regulator [Glaciimonas soli]|uniref:TetR family transcriptional regulator n=1 Tax=Glaciimonas soli TaxID=2590999 RepID=A0A843YQD8_9BURK|nr:TetR/AcrR family transcriptional regulator [Glaciimonas soli]MQR01280.1 TetR family transcriptional regulator [Glaciimonas soli]